MAAIASMVDGVVRSLRYGPSVELVLVVVLADTHLHRNVVRLSKKEAMAYNRLRDVP